MKTEAQYKVWVAKLAEKKGMSVEALEETYGDMPRDLFELGDDVEKGLEGLNSDDEEYSI